MSSAVVRMGLELFENDFRSEHSQHTEKKKKQTVEDPMKKISTSKRGIKKQLKKLKDLQTKQQHEAQKRKFKSAIDEYWKRRPKDHTEDNVLHLKQLMRMSKTDSKSTEMILTQHRGKLAKNRPDRDKKEETPTVFTDRDFDVFEKEYFS